MHYLVRFVWATSIVAVTSSIISTSEAHGQSQEPGERQVKQPDAATAKQVADSELRAHVVGSIVADSIWNARLARFKSQYHTSFVATGDVQSSLNSGTSSPPVSGSLGLSHYTPKERFKALIAVAGGEDTLSGTSRRRFASAVLAPGVTGNGKGSGVTLDYSRYFGDEICYPPLKLFPPPDTPATNDRSEYARKKRSYEADSSQFARCQQLLEAKLADGLAINKRLGGRVYVTFSKSTWSNGSTDQESFDASGLGLLSFGLHAVWVPLRHPASGPQENSFAFAIEGGYALRAIVGDITDESEANLRFGLLGTHRTTFQGLELEPSIELNKVSAFSVVTWLSERKHFSHVPGLTGVQAVLGFTFEAPLFTF